MLVALLLANCFIWTTKGFRISTSNWQRSAFLRNNHAGNTDHSPINANEFSRKYAQSFLTFTFLLPLPAIAGLFDSTEQSAVEKISTFQKPIFELLSQLKPSTVPNPIGVYSVQQVLRGGLEDSQVVLNYLETYINPCQKLMADVAPKLALNEADQKKVEVLPLLMKGHILELGQAIESQKADFQAREVEEVQETLADFLKLASTKYSVNPYIPPRPLSDSELFGPLGCEFWGKKRIEGSNSCAP